MPVSDSSSDLYVNFKLSIFLRRSTYGIYDVHLGNTDLKFWLVAQNNKNAATGVDIIVNGKKENDEDKSWWKRRSYNGVTKESLAERPIKHVLEDQRRLSIGYDLEKDCFTLKI